MVRSFFVSAFSSVVALTASGLTSVSAAALSEPDPIAIDAATADRAKRVLTAISSGTFDRSELAPQLNSFVASDFFEKGASLVSPLGAPQSMYAFEKRILADQTATLFRVRYPSEILTWVFSVDPDNRIVGLALRRAPNNRILSAFYRDVQY